MVADTLVPGSETGEPTGGDGTGDAPQPWWSRHLVAIAGGLGVGLLVYRYAVLPFVVTTFPAKAYLWIGVGALAGARKGFRAGMGDLTSGVLGRARITVGLIAAALTLGMAFLLSPPFGYLRLAPHSFPGFDLHLPAVGEVRNEMSDYSQGRVTVLRPGGFLGATQVSWVAGGLPDEEEIATVGRAFAATFGGNVADAQTESRAIAGADPAGKTWIAHVGTREIWMTIAPCGARRIMIITSGGSGLEQLHTRVFRTLRCRADAARDGSLGDVPVIFDIGAGWSRLPTTPDQLQLTNGRMLVMARPVPRIKMADKVADLVGASIPGVHIGAREGDHWPLEIEVDGQKQRGWLQQRDCPDLGQTLVLVSTGEQQASAEALAVLRGARCRRAGESPQHWPE